jgi:hypothetical protein
MIDNEDLQLKAEIDEIMNTVAAIMKKIEIACPPQAEAPSPHSN